MPAKLPLVFSSFLSVLAAGCVGDHVIVPGPGGIILLIAVVVALVAGGQQAVGTAGQPRPSEDSKCVDEGEGR